MKAEPKAFIDTTTYGPVGNTKISAISNATIT